MNQRHQAEAQQIGGNYLKPRYIAMLTICTKSKTLQRNTQSYYNNTMLLQQQ